MHLTSPRLWVVATPLGNPGDFSARARDVLEQADLVLAEDTRRAGLFFQRQGLTVKGRLYSLFEHNERERIPAVLRCLELGQSAALISDAGTPLMGDPGYRIVRACRMAGHPVSPVPGPCSPIAALSASGLPPQPFAFLGFPPRKPGDRKRLFRSWALQPATLVFFERNSRLQATLAVAAEVFGPRELCLARELTKEHEQFILGRLERYAELMWDPRGEMTVIIGPPEQLMRTTEADIDRILAEHAENAPTRDVASHVAGLVQGWSSKEIYERIVALARSRSRKAMP